MSPSRRSVVAAAGLASLAAGALTGCSRPERVQPGPVTLNAADVPVGSGLIVANSDYVVTQPTAGTFKAFDRTCPHAACPVSQVRGDQIVCTCHGSRFAIADGAVINGPAQAGLTAATVSESGGTLTVG